MLREIYARGMFYWLRAPRNYEDVRHDEWVLAVARLVLSICCLGVIIWKEGIAPGFHLKLLFAYLIYSLLILVALHVFPHWNPLSHMGVHCGDILWAAHLIVLIGHPGVFFALALFVMSSTAARWGFWEALLTAFFLCTFILLVHSYDGIPQQLDLIQAFELVPFALIGFAIAVAVGLLAEAKSVRAEIYSINRIIQDIHVQTGFETAVKHVSSTGFGLYGSTWTLCAIHNRETGKASLLQVAAPQVALEYNEIPHSQYGQYFFPEPAAAWRMARTRWRGRPDFKCHTLAAGKVRRDKTGFRVPDAFLAAHPFRRMLAVSLILGEELSLRFFHIDPRMYFGGAAGLRFLDRALRYLIPVIHDLLLVGRLRTDAEAAAGSRMARDLHDGVIQSLAGINLQLEELRRQASSSFPQSEDRLTHIQQSVQDEIVALREFTQKLRSHDIDSSSFLGFLSNLAVKFQCENGITTRFIPELDSVKLPPHVCSELVRIVLEVLVNVRKHSQASEVFIRLGTRNGDLVIGIFDNGRGFGFSGHYTHEELLASGKGPAVIMERARSINASVSIESVQGRGSCIEISLPQ